MANELAMRSAPQQEMILSAQRTAGDIVGMTRLVQEVMGAVMQDGQHYGKIPGCGDKPALLKPGAEKLCMTFRLAAMPDIQATDMGGGHREYRVLTKLVHIPTGDTWGVGVGVCSTMESKYRYRSDKSSDTMTDIAVPKAYWDAKKATPPNLTLATEVLARAAGKPGRYGTKKNDDGAWVITIRGESTGGKVENPDLADTYNTVLKMAKKRSLVDATLTAIAASDCFTQDIEELVDLEARTAPPAPEAVPEPPPTHSGPPAPVPPAQANDLDATALIILARFQNKDRKWNTRGVEEVHNAMRKVATQRKRKADVEFYREYLAEIDNKATNGDAK